MSTGGWVIIVNGIGFGGRERVLPDGGVGLSGSEILKDIWYRVRPWCYVYVKIWRTRFSQGGESYVRMVYRVGGRRAVLLCTTKITPAPKSELGL
jgi:hypothetical protein